MKKIWYYVKNNQRFGPVSPEELVQLAESKTINPSTFVWKKGLTKWASAAQIKGLFSSVNSDEIKKRQILKTDSNTSTKPSENRLTKLKFSPRWSFIYASIGFCFVFCIFIYIGSILFSGSNEVKNLAHLSNNKSKQESDLVVSTGEVRNSDDLSVNGHNQENDLPVGKINGEEKNQINKEVAENQKSGSPTDFKEIVLSPNEKQACKYIYENGGKLYVDTKKTGNPVVGVRHFGKRRDDFLIYENLSSLEYLDIRGPAGASTAFNVNIRPIRKLRNLKVLAFNLHAPKDFSVLSELDSLETLSFECYDYKTLKASIDELSKLKNLKNLRIGLGNGEIISCKPDDFEAIPKFPKLKFLEVWVQYDENAISYFAKSQSIRKLVLLNPYTESEEPFVYLKKGLNSLESAQNLKHIQLHLANNEICKKIAKLPHLEELIVGDLETEDSIAEAKAQFPNKHFVQSYKEFKAPYKNPLNNWMRELPAFSNWHQLEMAKGSEKFIVIPSEVDSPETVNDQLAQNSRLNELLNKALGKKENKQLKSIPRAEVKAVGKRKAIPNEFKTKHPAMYDEGYSRGVSSAQAAIFKLRSIEKYNKNKDAYQKSLVAFYKIEKHNISESDRGLKETMDNYKRNGSQIPSLSSDIAYKMGLIDGRQDCLESEGFRPDHE